MAAFSAPAVAYAALAALVGGESAGLPLPGETSLLASAVLASQGHLELPLVIAVGAGAAIVGDNAGYLIGRHGGRRLLARPGRWQHGRERLLAQGEAFFDRHGGKAVFLARWLPGLRVVGSWLAGAGRMRWSRFLFWNALGGVTWATTVALAGYSLGAAASTVLGAAGLALLVVLAATTAAVLFVRSHRRRAAPTGRAGTRSAPAPAQGAGGAFRR
jgi:membrane-associated protein